MKRLGYLWATLVSSDNLYNAFYQARKGKRQRHEVATFTLNLEQEMVQLQQELIAGSYRPGAYRQFTIYERKPRIISAAPFRDRVVHHALMNVLEPLDRRFIHDSYACRKGKGVHRAVDRYQQFTQRYPYVLKLDISRYFPSIDHQILKSQLAWYIKDSKVLELLDLIIDNSPLSNVTAQIFPGDDLVSLSARRYGIPIGNLTSQFFANLYLNGFDHWLKEQKLRKAYIRYVDDFFILGDDKTRLWELRDAIEHKLIELRLRLHPFKAQIIRTSERVDVLGYKISRSRRWLRNDNGYRFRRKLNKMAQLYHQRRLDWADINTSVQSWIGHARHAETEGLRNAIFSNVTFSRGAGRDAVSA